MNLVASFLETARRHGDRIAIIDGKGETITYAALAERSERLAAHWRARDIQHGDRVLLAMPVGIALYASIAALWRLGAVVVFPEPAMGLKGIRAAAEIAKPNATLFTGIYRLLNLIVPQLWRVSHRLGLGDVSGSVPAMDLGADHPALISFTSGSTGRPKAIVRTYAFLEAQNEELNALIAPTRPDETDLVAFPAFVIVNLALGITSVLPSWRLSRPDSATAPSIAAQVREHNVTRLLVQPAIAETIASGDSALPIHTLFTGGGPVFPDLLARLGDRLPDANIVAVYGSTEAEPIAHQSLADTTDAQRGAAAAGAGVLAGRPTAGTRVRIIDDEVVVTGAHVNRGYLNGTGDAENKLSIDDEIWHRTGDAGRIDDEGFLWLRGRLSAKAGTLYPFEIEVAARTWPGVKRAALIPGSSPPALAIEGTEPQPGDWLAQAKPLGIEAIEPMTIPLDRRHRSKVDYVELKRRLGR